MTKPPFSRAFRMTLPRGRGFGRSGLGCALAALLVLASGAAEAQIQPGSRGDVVTSPPRPMGTSRGPAFDPGGGAIGGLIGGVIGGIVTRPRPTIEIEDEVVVPARPRRPVVVAPERPARPTVGGAPPRKPPVQNAAKPPRKPPQPNVVAQPSQPAAKPAIRAAQTPPRTPPVARAAPPPAPVAAAEPDVVPDEVLFEARPGVPPAAVADLARSLRLTRVSSQPIALIGSTVHRYRIADRRSVDTVVAALRRDARVASAQANSVYRLQQAAPERARSPLADAQYALAKMRVPEAHRLATGEAVRVAVIDSLIDGQHPELAGAVTASFDPTGGKPAPHTHGTGVAGIIAARAQLTGVAPRVEVLGIRAFTGERGKPGADGTAFHIVQSLDWAVKQEARVVNMSFAGPKDDLLSRVLAAARGRGVVLVAAAGNSGPQAKPLYPAADENVIAVSASDAEDRIYAASNRGSHICVSAPGVDILMPAPGGAYQLSSGTSMAAPHVAGVVALLLQAQPKLTPDEVRAALVAAARDLGPAGQDPDFGAGFTDALAVLERPGAKPQASASPKVSADIRTVGVNPSAPSRD